MNTNTHTHTHTETKMKTIVKKKNTTTNPYDLLTEILDFFAAAASLFV